MNNQIGLKQGFEERLDIVAENIINNEKCPIPGFVVLAKRGDHTYHKAFGYSDKEKNIPMKLDSQFRCFSMTKVFASTTALILKEEGLIDLEATVGSYIPAFDKEFEVITEPIVGETEIMEIPYTSFMTGKTSNLSYCKKVTKNKILVKHCLAESAGIGYDMWTDFDLAFDQPIFGHQYGVAQALRRKNGIGYYTSNTIIGQNATLEEYCNAIAAAGYLVAEPGTFSYGLGALILGRIIEVVLEKETGKFLRFSEICNEKLFKPLSKDQKTSKSGSLAQASVIKRGAAKAAGGAAVGYAAGKGSNKTTTTKPTKTTKAKSKKVSPSQTPKQAKAMLERKRAAAKKRLEDKKRLEAKKKSNSTKRKMIDGNRRRTNYDKATMYKKK